MRAFKVLITSVILLTQSSVALADSSKPSTEFIEKELDTLEQQTRELDRELLEVLIYEPQICCQLKDSDLPDSKTIAGLLFWGRLRILCKGLGPTAYC